MEICILSTQNFKKKHVSQDMVNGFENVMVHSSDSVKRIYISELLTKINRKIRNIISAENQITDIVAKRQISNIRPDYVLFMAMGVNELLDVMPLLKTIDCKKAIYCIDTWSANYKKWFEALSICKVDTVFLAYKASIPEFKKHINNVYFLPQSMNQKWFYPRESSTKTHLFMQMGRKNKTLDSYVLQYIKEKKLSDDCYIREREKGRIIYPSFEELAEEIGKTYFFVLAPRSIDDENYTGKISDVTARFYEGMACKTMLIGFKPQDTFDELFPIDNAMIDVSSYEDFADKVDYYLNNRNEYERICENNYHYLVNNHTWEHRMKTILKCLNDVTDETDR